MNMFVGEPLGSPLWHDFGINLWNRKGYSIDMTIKNGDLMGFIQQTMVIQPTKMELLVGITKKIIQLDGVRKTQVLSVGNSLWCDLQRVFLFLRVLIWSHRTPLYYLYTFSSSCPLKSFQIVRFGGGPLGHFSDLTSCRADLVRIWGAVSWCSAEWTTAVFPTWCIWATRSNPTAAGRSRNVPGTYHFWSCPKDFKYPQEDMTYFWV